MSGAPSQRAARRRQAAVLAAMTLAAAGAGGGLWAQASVGGYSIPRQVVATGANGAQGAGYVLSGTLGQATAGPSFADGYHLSGGFRRSLVEAVDSVFADGFE